MNMKTIGKKIKAIYFLAIIAIVSICMAILPLMSTNVKADSDRTLKVVGAHATVVDKTTSSQNFDGDYAVSFKAEFTKSLYDYLTTNYDVVKFGMLIGPADNYAAVTSIETALANDYVDSCYLGNKESAQYISFQSGELTFSYEATREYSEADITADATTNAAKTQALLEQSNQDLTAIPYYMANGTAVLVKAEQPVVRSARKLINDEFILSNLQFEGNNVYSRYVGTFDDEYLASDYYIEKSTGKVYKADANNELLPFAATDFIGAGQLVVAAQDVVSAATDEFVLDQATIDALEVGNDYAIAVFDADNNVRGIKAKVITKILSTKEDFFNDVDGDGVGDVARANYIFHLDCVKNTSDGNYTTQTVIEGYYILGNNIDFGDVTEFVAAAGDVRPQLASATGGFSATLDGRGFAISNISVGTASGGLLGMLNGATIKNIAFDGIASNRNDEFPSLLAYRVYNTTLENVYIRAKASTGNHKYVGEPKAFYQILDQFGQSSFTNVIFENQDALVAGNTAKFARVAFADDKTSVYENVNVIGLPTYAKASQHVAAAGDTPAQHTLVMKLPLSTIKSYVAGPGVYELSKTGNAATVYADLIANINAGETKNIQYIEFVEDNLRGYYVDNAAISADAAAVKAYIDSGYWSKIGGSLVWNSLEGERFTVKSNNADDSNFKFVVLF